MSITKYSEVDFYGNFCTMGSEDISENFTYMDNEIKKYPNDLVTSAYFSDNNILDDYEMTDIDKYKNVPKSKMKEALENGTIQYEGAFTSEEMDDVEHIHFNAEFTYPLQSECRYLNQLVYEVNRCIYFIDTDEKKRDRDVKRFLEIYDRKYTTQSIVMHILKNDKLILQKVYSNEYFDKFETMIHKVLPTFKNFHDVMKWSISNLSDEWEESKYKKVG